MMTLHLLYYSVGGESECEQCNIRSDITHFRILIVISQRVSAGQLKMAKEKKKVSKSYYVMETPRNSLSKEKVCFDKR